MQPPDLLEPEIPVIDPPAPDALSTPVAWTDAGGVILGVNAAFARWLGVGARRLVGKPLATLEMDGDAMSRFLDNTDRDLLRLHRVALGLPGEAPRLAQGWLSRTDQGHWLLEAHPLEDSAMLDPAQMLPAALGAALRGLAHELRNPLAGLKGAAQLLSRRAANRGGDEDERALIELIGSEIERLNALLERLLSPTPERAHARLNIHAVLERVLRLAEADGGSGVRLQRDYDPSLPEINGDADRLVQLAWNLVSNAIQAGATVVTLRTRVEHGQRIHDRTHALTLRLEIIDNGRGVPEELAEHLFLPLVSGRAEGSGLGLALAQQVAREHAGTLGYRSRPGHTVFTLLLPQARPDEGGPHHVH